MNIIEPLLLGLVQGLTEFIPVSSSGHLFVLPQIFSGSEYLSSTSFILFLHFGTLLSLLFYYRKLIVKYIRDGFKFISKQPLNPDEKKSISVIKSILIATIPAAILGLIFEKILSNFYDNNLTRDIAFLAVAVPMIVMGFLFVFEKRIVKNNTKEVAGLEPKNALIIGISQCLAFIRGVSRSGITLITGQLTGLSRVSAAEFSFLMSIPIITASSVYEVISFLRDSTGFSQDMIVSYIVGFVSSFVFGLIAIDFLLKFLRNKSLSLFGYYRIYFGVFLIFLVLFK